jgi:hypothetical protein
MTAPTAPYCGTDDVAALVPHLVRAASDFSAETQPTKVAVTRYVTWLSAQVDQAFAALGFYVPYQEISGESWPDNQTYMLELMVATGAAGLCVGPVAKPAPAMGRDSGKTANAFTTTYNNFLASIPLNAAGFRMDYRPGTRAEKITRTPRGPVTDHLLGYIDPTRFQSVEEFTRTIEQLRKKYAIDTTTSQWDHLKTLRDTLG